MHVIADLGTAAHPSLDAAARGGLRESLLVVVVLLLALGYDQVVVLPRLVRLRRSTTGVVWPANAAGLLVRVAVVQVAVALVALLVVGSLWSGGAAGSTSPEPLLLGVGITSLLVLLLGATVRRAERLATRDAAAR